MVKRYLGGVLSPTTPTVTALTASGMYTVTNAAQYRAAGTWPQPSDIYFEYVSMLLPGNGTNGAQNNTFLDSSTNNFTITRNGNTTQGTFSPYGANWSNYFDGTGDYLSLAANSAFDITSGDFTVEMWIYRTTNGVEQYLWSNRADTPARGWEWRINSTNLMQFFFTGGSSLTSTGTVPTNTWTHLAVSRQTNTVRFFIDGALDSSTTFSNGTAVTTSLFLGYSTSGGGYLTGYMSNARLVKGTAVYTAAFTPSTTPLTAIANTSLLTCADNRFIDDSTNNFTITRNGDVSVQRFSPFNPSTIYAAETIGGSGYFDGTGDYLTVPDNAAFEMTADFTVEAWFYPTSNATDYQTIVSKSASGIYAPYIFYYRGTLGTVQFSSSTDGASYNLANYTSLGSVALNTWNHVAVSRSGSSVRLFLNGALITTITNSSALTDNSNAVGIGGRSDGTELLTGYVSNVRIVKGTAVYTAAFTPSTTPLTAIANTSLLLNLTNAGIIDNAMINDLETVGNAQISTSVSKWGGGSLAFDGSGDWVNAPPTQNLEFGGGDFTFEFWLYPLDTTRRAIYHGSDGADWSMGIDFQSQKVCIWASSNGSSWNLINADGGGNGIGTITVSLNAWTHVAFVRSGTTWQTYINGVRDLNLTGISGSIVNRATYAKSIGKWWFTNGVGNPTMWNGYIDDLRITKGYARYTANFTAPTAPFQLQ